LDVNEGMEKENYTTAIIQERKKDKRREMVQD
jgi:hypothetical protein